MSANFISRGAAVSVKEYPRLRECLLVWVWGLEDGVGAREEGLKFLEGEVHYERVDIRS
jgi:hypothetical protein